ncbi:MAG: nicotinate phosphoribosyltransferase, partial [Actinoplanes sp.]|nr:nicotinate phosphoribosyltransferase [Actinoplanes sp.]
HKPTGTAIEEIVMSQGVPDHLPNDRLLQTSFVAAGEILPAVSLAESREHLRQCLISIPWEGLKLSAGDAAIPVTIVPTV